MIAPAVTTAGPRFTPGSATLAAAGADDAAADSSTDTDTDTELSADETAEQAPAQGPAAATRSWQEPVAVGVIADTGGTAVSCRAEASAEAPVITELWAGNAVELTGDEVVDGVGTGWYPINCAGVGGFVRSAFVVVEDKGAEVAEATTEEVSANEPEADAEVNTEAAPETASEETEQESTTDAVAVEETTETATTDEVASDEVATDEVATDEDAEETAAETDEAATSEEPVAEDDVEAATDDAEAVTESVAEQQTDTDPTGEVDGDTDFATDAATDTATDSTTDTLAEPVTEDVTTEQVIETGTESETESESEADAEVATEPVADEETTESEAATETTTASETETQTATEIVPEADHATETETETETVTVTVTVTKADTATETETEAATEATTEAATEATDATTEAVTEPATKTKAAATPTETAATAQATPAIDLSRVIGTAEVAGTGGAGLRCRTTADLAAPTITVLAEGTTVQVLDAPTGDWLEIVCGGQRGFAAVRYLYAGGADPDDFAAGDVGRSVTVTGTGGSLNCRASASTTARIITRVAEGSKLAIRGLPSSSWLPVVCAGQNGYVAIAYVSAPSSTSGGGTTVGTARVVNTGGAGVRCRTGAGTGYSTITIVPEGSTVSVRGSSSGGWTPVVCGGRNGFISSSYLSTGSSGGSGSTSGLVRGDRAKTTASLNLRYAASSTAKVAAVAPTGTVVLVTGSRTNGYYPVDWDGLRGYMSASYLVETTQALSQRGGSSTDSGSGSGSGSTGGSATGNAIASFARAYLGYPYVWGTHGPSSFDCSGFTYWVIYNVTGRNIGYGLWTQVSAGVPVSRSNLQPGDLVFFQNTYKAGLSHAGVYIGNGQFIHAANPSTDVKISDLNSDYYATRWYGARRIH